MDENDPSELISIKDTIDIHKVEIESEKPEISQAAPAKLHTIYPNPAMGNTTVKYAVTASGQVQLSLLNSIGIVQKNIEIYHSTPGVYYKNIDTEHLENGTYLIQLSSGEIKESLKLIINR